MKLVRLKLFSGYDSELSGTSYIPAQVVTGKIVIDPISNVINTIDSSSLKDIEPIRRKTRRISNIIRPLEYILSEKYSLKSDKGVSKKGDRKKKKGSSKKIKEK